MGTKPTDHSPAPWTARQVQTEAANAFRIVAHDGTEVALLFYGPSKANAFLIAAAPELLEAAIAAERHVHSVFECGAAQESCPVRAYLRAAIANAEVREASNG